jgi:hypothetical protein
VRALCWLRAVIGLDDFADQPHDCTEPAGRRGCEWQGLADAVSYPVRIGMSVFWDLCFFPLAVKAWEIRRFAPA